MKFPAVVLAPQVKWYEMPCAMEERKSKLEALRYHLAEGATQASKGDFVDNFSMDSLINALDAES